MLSIFLLGFKSTEFDLINFGQVYTYTQDIVPCKSEAEWYYTKYIILYKVGDVMV